MINESDVLSLFERHCEGIKSTGSSQYVALCPFHDDTRHSFSFNTANTKYNCFGCNESGNAVKFAKKIGENHKPFYSDDYQTVKNGAKQVDKQPNNKAVDLSNKLSSYKIQYPDDKGYTPFIMNDVGKDKDGAITFPYFDNEGRVIGIKHHKPKNGKSSWWEGDGRLKWYNEWQFELFNKDQLIICEGEKDANRLVSLGYDATSGSGGALSIPPIPDKNKGWFASKEIIFLLDNDKAGRDGAVKHANALHKELGILPYIGQWRDGLLKGFDAFDDRTGEEVEYAINNKRIYEPRRVNDSQEGEIKTMGIFQLIDADYTAPEIVVRNMVQQESLSIISGCSGIGKSWIALNMGLSIAGGTPLFGFFEVDKPRKVLMAQFELTNGQVKERVEILQSHYNQSWAAIGSNFDYVILDEDNPSFTDRWQPLDNLLSGGKYKGGVVIVDNLYTSVDANVDTSNNHDLIPVVSKWSEMMTKYQVSIVIITHHLKGRKRTPIDHDDILGGATLTRFASNIFQIKNSLLSHDLRVAMITKVRGEESHLVEIPFKLKFIDGVFEKGEVINNEALHYLEANEKWEIQLVREMKAYESQWGECLWSRADLWTYLSTQGGWEQTPTNERKVSRFISRTMDWGLMEKIGHNQYRIIASEFGDE